MIYNRLYYLMAAVLCFFTSLFGGLKSADYIEAKQYEINEGGNCQLENGRIAIHDPSIMELSNGEYYIFGTHCTAAKSNDLVNWTSVASGTGDLNRLLVPEGKTLREVLAEPLSWTDAYQVVNNYPENGWQTNIWAADVIYNPKMGKYCYYASCSVWGTPASVIWMAVSDNIEGPYEYKDTIVYSGFNKRTVEKEYIRENSLHYDFTNIKDLLKKGIFKMDDVQNASWFDIDGNYDHTVYPNCIDPALFYDKDGNLWMTYGSFFGGTYIMPMDEKTGMPDYEYMKNHDDYDMYFGKKLFNPNHYNDLSGEGPYIIYDEVSDYYYMFVTYKGLNALGGYNIRQFRSKTPDGLYYDAVGNTALDWADAGIKLFGNYQFSSNEIAYLSGGHCSAMTTSDGKILLSYHTRFNNGTDGYETRIRELVRTQDGWLTALPFEHLGESDMDIGFSTETVSGEYEFIAHGNISNTCEGWADVDNIIAPTQTITLNEDGTISNLRVYESVRNNTKVSYKEVNGTWQLVDGTPYIEMTIDSVEYKGVLDIQKDESKGHKEKIVFSLVGNNNEALWGVKQ
ncbi:MAG: glycoside hydrolase family 43 protein [Clostridia bacterium]|nr:glycoside hydrolase family 43 protein [Clostridia bacterium]